MSLFYQIIRPFLHCIDAEKAHGIAIHALSKNLVPGQTRAKHPMLQQTLWGINFENPVGLAAGFDKNGETIANLHKQGFGFAEVGTVTPKPQDGNPKPRIFRLEEDLAVINRLGFNNEGADAVYARLKALPKTSMVVGVNIGRNKDCEHPIKDYTHLVQRMAEVADYITINVSSPNTKGLRDLQQKRHLEELLKEVIQMRDAQMASRQKPLPLMLKIAPDIDQATKEDIAELVLSQKLDGLIVSNTTIKRPNTLQNARRSEVGGLSGPPLFSASTKLLAQMYGLTKGQLPLIGVGGISSSEDAYQKILAGASLVQLYTAFVYQGFGLVGKINDGLVKMLAHSGYTNITHAVGTKYEELAAVKPVSL